MADTWNHAIRPTTLDEIDLYARQGWTCATGRCCTPVSHVISYNLVTGRSGRVGSRESKVCTAHADKFAVKHGLAAAHSCDNCDGIGPDSRLFNESRKG